MTENRWKVAENSWKVAVTFYSVSLKEALEIIDDATVNGFEFKVEDGEIYFREVIY